MSYRITDLPDRIAEKIMPVPDGCWLWTAGIGSRPNDGYGRVSWKGKPSRAHRVTYELLVGPIPESLVIDHLCRVRSCVNPDHLEAVSHRTNLLRGEGPPATLSRRTHCKRGHPFTPENTYFYGPDGRRRRCNVCKNAKQRGEL